MELENRTDEQDALDAESRRVAALLSSLRRVEAPANFEFGVKAKIVAGVARETRGGLLPSFKILVPLSLVLVVVAFVVFYGGYTDISDTVVEKPAAVDPQVEKTVADVIQTESAPGSRGPQIDETATVSETVSTAPVNATRSQRTARSRRQNGSFDQPSRGDSFDEALRAPKTIDPPGFPPRGVTNQNSDFDTDTEVSVREVLQTIGINADFADGGWRVRSASDRSIAGRSGIKTGDVVEAIDDKVLTETTLFRGTGSGKILRVRRDGKQITVNLKN